MANDWIQACSVEILRLGCIPARRDACVGMITLPLPQPIVIEVFTARHPRSIINFFIVASSTGGMSGRSADMLISAIGIQHARLSPSMPPNAMNYEFSDRA